MDLFDEVASATPVVDASADPYSSVCAVPQRRPNSRRQPEHAIRLDERRRIGRELHDSTAQLLVALQLGLMRLRADLDDANSSARLVNVTDAIVEIQQEIRAICCGREAHFPEEGDFPAALTAMARHFSRLTGLQISVHVEADFVCCAGPIAKEFYRIAQEALANVHRHAEANNVEIRLCSTAQSARMSIADDGIGIFSGTADVGVGLGSIRQRAIELGGTLSVRQLAQGTEIAVRVPNN